MFVAVNISLAISLMFKGGSWLTDSHGRLLIIPPPALFPFQRHPLRPEGQDRRK